MIENQLLTGNRTKTAIAFQHNASEFFRRTPINQVGFLTLTFPDGVVDFRLARKRFHQLLTKYLRPYFGHYLCVAERTKLGVIHYHLIIDCKVDIKSGFDFGEFVRYKRNRRRGRIAGANNELRKLWKFLREVCEPNGFGRHELVPIRTNAEGVTKYLSKYLAKAIQSLDKRDKGARLVSYSLGWKVASSRFSFLSPRAVKWRAFAAAAALLIGATEFDIAAKMGRHWAFDFTSAFQCEQEPTQAIENCLIRKAFACKSKSYGERTRKSWDLARWRDPVSWEVVENWNGRDAFVSVPIAGERRKLKLDMSYFKVLRLKAAGEFVVASSRWDV